MERRSRIPEGVSEAGMGAGGGGGGWFIFRLSIGRRECRDGEKVDRPGRGEGVIDVVVCGRQGTSWFHPRYSKKH